MLNGSEVNLAARLESRAEVGKILLAHETYSLVKDEVLAEERESLTVKGFARPIRNYTVVGHRSDLALRERLVNRSCDGLSLSIDRNKLTEESASEAIRALEEILSQIRRR